MKKTILLITVVLFAAPGLFAKRTAPREVAPIVHNGVKYIVHHFGISINKKQNGGYIEAFDIEKNKRLWLLRIYKIRYIRNLEKDIQDIFITKIEIKGNMLIVHNEKNDVFSVDLTTLDIEPRNKVYRFR